MKVSELIECLQAMPQDMDVHIFDWRKNLHTGGGESSPAGIEKVEHVEVVPSDEDIKLEIEIHGDADDLTQFVAIHYENDDYDETEAEPVDDSMIAEHFRQKFNRLLKRSYDLLGHPATNIMSKTDDEIHRLKTEIKEHI